MHKPSLFVFFETRVNASLFVFFETRANDLKALVEEFGYKSKFNSLQLKAQVVFLSYGIMLT